MRPIDIATLLSRAIPFIGSTRIWPLMALLLASSASGTQITGVIKDPAGNGINGTMTMQLNQPGQDTVNHIQIAPVLVTYPLSNGVPPTFAAVIGNDTIAPGGTFYVVKYYDTSGYVISAANFVITGSTFDMGQATPTTVTTDNVSYFNPISADQDIAFTGHISFAQPVGTTGQQQTAVSTSFITTAVTTESVSIPGITLSAHCTFAARDATAAANTATSWFGPVGGGNMVTFNHVATAGMHYDFVCTPH